MKKFGISRKDKSASGSPAPDDDSNRSALFGSRKPKNAPPGGNPYAQGSGNPYAQQTASPPGGQYGGLGAPPAYDGQLSDRQRSEKSAVPPGGYGGGDRFAGGGSNYGSQGGYGGDRYGNGNGGAQRRPGGYGGLGGDDDADDSGRNALFGNASERFQQQKPGGLPSQQRPGGNPQSGMGAAYGEDGQGYGGGYGAAYQDRQLTAEEEEEEDVSAMKSEIRQMKQQDVSSTRNALRLAAQAEQSGYDTLNRLGTQGERIHKTEEHLDYAHNEQDISAEKARELKKLNGSMFAVHVSNPFMKGKNRERRDQRIMDRANSEREAREATRKARFETEQRSQGYQNMAQNGAGGPGRPAAGRNLAERSKYQFEADSEDDEMENEIEDNLDALHGAAKRLGGVAKAMGEEVETQNRHMDRVGLKTDKVEDQLTLNRARLDRIR